MKKLLFACCLMLLALTPVYFVSCNNADAATAVESKVVLNPDMANELKELGFTKSSSIKRLKMLEERKFYMSKGFKYVPNDVLMKEMTDNNWFIGPASAYIGEIPDVSGIRIIQGCKELKKYHEPQVILTDKRVFTVKYMESLPEPHKTWAKEHSEPYNDIAVFIVAPLDKFDGTVEANGREMVPKKLDPIAVVKLNHGYIELARW